MSAASRSRLLAASGIVLAWTACGLFFFTQDVFKNLSEDPRSRGGSPGVVAHRGVPQRGLDSGHPLARPPLPLRAAGWVRRVALHLVFSVAFAIVHLVVDSAIVHRLGSSPAS